jgi:hypothetical protein
MMLERIFLWVVNFLKTSKAKSETDVETFNKLKLLSKSLSSSSQAGVEINSGNEVGK